MFKQIVLTLSDLQQLAVCCSHCQTEVVLDLAHKPPAEPFPRRSMVVLICPVCQIAFDSTVQSNLDKFRQAYQGLTENTATDVTFRLKKDTLFPQVPVANAS